MSTIGKLFFSLPLLFFISLILIPYVHGAPPITTVQQITTGYSIVDSTQYLLKTNAPYQYNFFVYNISNGLQRTNTTVSCIFYIANSTGEVIFYNSTSYLSDGHWGIDVPSSIFSLDGFYAYGTKCNSSTLGGATTGLFEVTSSGNENLGFYIIIFSLMLIFLLSGILGKNIALTFVGATMAIFVGLYCVVNGIYTYNNETTDVLSIIIIIFGAYWAWKASEAYFLTGGE